MKKQTHNFRPQRFIAIIVAIFALAIFPVAKAYADIYDDQIRALEGEISQFQNEAGRLRAQADTLQNQVNALQAERSQLQAQISLNETELQRLSQQIAETERKIIDQQGVLGSTLVDLYLDESVTPLEALASSKSISDFIDKQEYRESIRQELQGTIEEIQKLKDELNKQKVAVEQKLKDQKAQREQLVAKEQEQANLLNQTQGQEAAYQQLASQRNSKVAELRAQQAAANAKWGGGNVQYQARGGGLPSYWADPPMDTVVDNWGMWNRECVNYTAFRVAASGRHMPYWGGVGNANQWDDNARAAGIPVDGNPKVGDVAVWHTGFYGHVMYVEAVHGDGAITISEYNFDWTGRYSMRHLSASNWRAQGLVFIHF